MQKRITTTFKRQTNKNGRNRKDAIPKGLILSSLNFIQQAQQSLFSRTGQTIYSFSSSAQTYFVNLPNLLVSTTWWTSSVIDSSNNPLYEYIKIRGITVRFSPKKMPVVSTTFEPSVFGLRYVHNAINDSSLKPNYFGAINPVHKKFLVDQTSTQQSFHLSFPDKFYSTAGFLGTMGTAQSVYQYQNDTSNAAGILILIQPEVCVNTISAYNPVIGSIEIDFHITLCNSLV
jgi:hypothetical protein